MSRGSDKQHSSHLPLLTGFLPSTPTHPCYRLAEALARHMFPLCDDMSEMESLSEQLRSSSLVARGCDSPADALLMLIRFSVHDVPLFCDKGRRWTTNCASLFAYIKAERPELAAAFLEGI